jgi:hypothetical protein
MLRSVELELSAKGLELGIDPYDCGYVLYVKKSEQKSKENPGFGHVAWFPENIGKEKVGWLGWYNIYKKELMNKGLGTIMVGSAFLQMDQHEISHAQSQTYNYPSRRIMENLGFPMVKRDSFNTFWSHYGEIKPERIVKVVYKKIDGIDEGLLSLI